MNHEELINDSLSLLRQMITIAAYSGEEEAVAALVSDALERWGIGHTRPGGNIVTFNRHYDPAKPTLALDAHLDTVHPADSWSRDPFDPGDEEAVIHGLGSNDDGGSVVAMIAALRHFYDHPMPINLALLLTREEEVEGRGGAGLIYGENSGIFPGGTPRWVIFGEPTRMKAAISERGLLVLDGEATGVTGHAARNEGVNALYIALEDIERMRSHRFGRISPEMGEVRLNVTQIQAGWAHNVIPDHCRFVADIRPTECYTNEEIVEELQALCRSRLTPRSLHHRASATPAASPLLRTVRELGLETFSSPTTSNWIHFRGEAFKMGPGDSARSHRADEYILASEIADGIGTYIQFIESFYGNTLE